MSEIIIQKIIMPVHCPACGYDWNTESLNYYVSCPRCRYTVKIRKQKKQKAAMSGRAAKHNQTAAVTGPKRPEIATGE